MVALHKMFGTFGLLTAVCAALFGLLLGYTGPTHAAIDRGANDFYERALELREQNDAIAAVIELKNALKADPRHLSAQLLIGEIYLDQGLGAAAEDALRAAQTRGADRNVVTPMLAKALLRQGKYAKLVTEISADGLSPENAAQVHTIRAQALLGQGLREKARSELGKALNLTPDALEPNLVRISTLLQAGEIGEAERRADALVREHPMEPDAWLAASSVAQLRGDFDGALVGYTRALEASPRHLTARLGRIALLIDLKREDEAKEDFDYLAREFAKDPRASYMRAVWLARMHDEAGTTAALRAVLDIVKQFNDRVFAEDPVLNLMTGMSYYGLGAFQQAAVRLQSYVKQQPADLGARKALGDALLRIGDAAQAATVLETAVERNPRDPKAVALLAAAYARTQRFRQANSLLEQAIALGGANEELESKLAMLQLSVGNFREGLPTLERKFADDADGGELGVPLVAAYLNYGDVDSALGVAEKLLRSAPENPVYLNLLGVVHFRAGRFDEAERQFAAALARAPDFVPASMNLAKLELARGEVDAARARIAPLLKSKPDSPQFMLEMSRIEMAAGREREALKLAEDAWRNAPKDRATLFHLFDTRMRVQKYDAALDLILAAEIDRPGDFEVLSRHATLLIRTGKTDALRPLLKKMADASTQHSEHLLEVAQLQFDHDLIADAEYTVSKIFQNQAEHERAGLLAVQIALKKGDVAEALSRSAAQLEQFPNSPATHMMRGEALMAAGDYPAALASFDAVLARQPATPAVVRGYHALLAAGDEDAARRRLREWLAAHPEDLEVKNVLAEDHLRKGEIAAADALFEELLRARPRDPALLNNVANTRHALGKPDALKAARAALELDPENAMFNDTVGWLLVQSEQAADGLPFLRSASARLAEDPEIRFHLASCLHRMGRQAEAKRELEKALRTGTDFDGRAQALELQKSLLEQAAP